MSGNVWEWCWDSNPYDSNKRCYCGGSWYHSANYCEVSNELWGYAYDSYFNLGFRIVRSTGNR